MVQDADDEISLSCVEGVVEQAKDSEERGEGGGQDDETFPDDQDSSYTSARVCLSPILARVCLSY